jgi:hypothetical protein
MFVGIVITVGNVVVRDLSTAITKTKKLEIFKDQKNGRYE